MVSQRGSLSEPKVAPTSWKGLISLDGGLDLRLGPWGLMRESRLSSEGGLRICP